jgi:hypothetical protein
VRRRSDFVQSKTATQLSISGGIDHECPVAAEILGTMPNLDDAYDLLLERAPDDLAWLVEHLPEAVFVGIKF